MRRVELVIVERSILLALVVTVIVLATRTHDPGPDDATPGPSGATPSVASSAADETEPRSPVPEAQLVELLDAAARFETPTVPDPLPRPMLGWDELSEGLPSVGQWRGRSLLEDLDGDGHLDLVTSVRRLDHATPGEGLMVYLGDGAGNWTRSTDGLRRDMSYGGSAVSDVDGDGRLDLAFSGHNVTPHVFLADGTGSWRGSATGIDVTGMCADVALGDMDRDGLVDLATLGFQRDSCGLVLFVGVGGGTFARMLELLPADVFGAQVHMLDLDGDDHPELLASTSLGPKVWRWDGADMVEMSDGLPTPEIGGSDLGIAARDLDGDGFSELLVTGMIYTGHSPLRLYRWDGSAWRPWGQGLPEDESFFDGCFARLGDDAETCLVLAGRAGIGLVAMRAPGTFESLGRLEGTEGVFNVTAGDVDGDGREEVVFVGIGGVRVMSPQLPGERAEPTEGDQP
jgi:hypothetical protein